MALLGKKKKKSSFSTNPPENISQSESYCGVLELLQDLGRTQQDRCIRERSMCLHLFLPFHSQGIRGGVQRPRFPRSCRESVIHFQGGAIGKHVGRFIYATSLLLRGGVVVAEIGLQEEVRAPVGSAAKHVETSKHRVCEGEPKMASEPGFI